MKILIANLLLIFPLLVFADYGQYDARLIRVIDGDTVEVSLYLLPGLEYTTKLRIDGINTAETRTRDKCEKAKGLAAKQFAIDLLKTKFLTVDNLTEGKYAGRLLGDLYINGESFADIMIESGHAREYHGGKRLPWCLE